MCFLWIEFIIRMWFARLNFLITIVFFFLEKNEFETKITSVQYTTIQALLKYTNYSISILAFTSKGDGIQSDPIYCKTEEDCNTMLSIFDLHI